MRFDELREGRPVRVPAGEVTAVVVLQGGALHALEDCCSHDECALSEGLVEEGVIICPCHGAEFDLSTGEALCLPATEPVRRFEVEVENGNVVVRVPA